MRFEIFIFGITSFLIYNTYHDGKYTKMMMTWKKYYQMAFFAVIGIGIYVLMKRNPTQGKNMLVCANNMIKYMPINKSSMDLFSPIIDLTSNYQPNGQTGGEQRILNSGKMATKRCVSETKKKYVASNQHWKCGECNSQLNAWFEVDHKIRLEHGGGNDVNNLIALCRECHGKKTSMENM
jgi:HNH endonuclease